MNESIRSHNIIFHYLNIHYRKAFLVVNKHHRPLFEQSISSNLLIVLQKMLIKHQWSYLFTAPCRICCISPAIEEWNSHNSISELWSLDLHSGQKTIVTHPLKMYIGYCIRNISYKVVTYTFFLRPHSKGIKPLITGKRYGTHLH